MLFLIFLIGTPLATCLKAKSSASNAIAPFLTGARFVEALFFQVILTCCLSIAHALAFANCSSSISIECLVIMCSQLPKMFGSLLILPIGVYHARTVTLHSVQALSLVVRSSSWRYVSSLSLKIATATASFLIIDHISEIQLFLFVSSIGSVEFASIVPEPQKSQTSNSARFVTLLSRSYPCSPCCYLC
jgi:hypothetical protein